MSAIATMPFVDEIGAQVAGRAEVRREARQVADHESRGEGLTRLDVVDVHADVADVRIRERDDLAGVGRIGEDLLVAGHRRVEDDFARGVALGADRATSEDAAVGKRQHCRRCRRKQRRADGGSGGRIGHGGIALGLGVAHPFRGSPDVRSGNAGDTRSRSRSRL